MPRNAWTARENRGAITAYFRLLEAQAAGETVNKSEIYRTLSQRYPRRTPKAFEYKFQNISAVLYELKLPFADGLRPMGNFQGVLRDLVLDYLHQHAPVLPNQPIEILTDKLRRLWRRGYLPLHGRGSGRFGLTLEHYLGIPKNSAKTPDFMGIELKTKFGDTLQTLFSRTPSNYIACKDKQELVERFGYFDSQRNRQSLYTSFNNTPDSLGFFLIPRKMRIVINQKKLAVLEYQRNRLEDALLEKHNETAFLSVIQKKNDKGRSTCRFDSMLYCRSPSYDRFVELVRQGSIYLDFTLSITNGRARDHGFLWRCEQCAVPDLYKKTRHIDLTCA